MVASSLKTGQTSLRKRALFSGVVLGIALLATEGLVRAFVPPAYWVFLDASSDWERDPLLGWDQKGALDLISIWDSRAVRFTTNLDGLQPATATADKPSSKIRIMIFGDSTVVGRGVPEEERVHSQLQQQLQNRGVEAEVLNAGVQGFSTDQTLLKMEELVPRYKPDIILYGLCSNDLGGIAQEIVYGWPKPRFEERPGGLRVLPPPKIDLVKSYSPRAFIQRIALYRLLQPYILVVRSRLGGWDTRNTIGFENVSYYLDPESLGRADWRLFGLLLERMKGLADKHQSSFYFYPHPALEEVWDPVISQLIEEAGVEPEIYDRHALERRLQQESETQGVHFVPLINSFLSHSEEGPFHFLPRDPHCNSAGYRLTAAALASRLFEEGLN